MSRADDETDDGFDDAPDHDGLIARMAAFAGGLPLTAELAPFRGPLGDVVGVELTDLFADEPGRGAGTAYMTRLLEEAEDVGIALYLRPDGPRSRAFYERFGFERTGRVHGGMAWLPPLPSWLLAP